MVFFLVLPYNVCGLCRFGGFGGFSTHGWFSLQRFDSNWL